MRSLSNWFLLIFIFLISGKASALDAVFTKIGEKVFLKSSGPYHFSSKEGLKVFLKSTPPFFVTSRVGVFEFYEKAKKQKLISLTQSQFKFYSKVRPLVEKLTDYEWKISKGALTLQAEGLPEEIRAFLIEKCGLQSTGDVSLDFILEAHNTNIPLRCQRRLKPLSSRQIQLMVVGASKSSNSNYGLGVPAAVKWRLGTGSNLELSEQGGDLNLNKGHLRSKGDSFFTSDVSLGNPVVFETGSEVGIQQQGLFNRQPTEWKRATTNININLEESEKNEARVKVSFNRKNRTAQGLIFEIEKLEKSVFLTDGKWQKVLSFQDSNTARNKNGVFGLGLSGSSSKARSQSNKEVWLRLSPHE